jgi:hypothetical protein
MRDQQGGQGLRQGLPRAFGHLSASASAPVPSNVTGVGPRSTTVTTARKRGKTPAAYPLARVSADAGQPRPPRTASEMV